MQLIYADLTYKIRQCVFDVHSSLGTGYDEETYHYALILSLKKSETGKAIQVQYEGHVVRNYEMKIPLVENKILCGVVAIHDRIDFYDIAKLKTYMKALNIKIGLIVNFGKKYIEIQGVSI